MKTYLQRCLNLFNSLNSYINHGRLMIAAIAALMAFPAFSEQTCVGQSWAPDSRFVAKNDTVYDKKTKLTWKRCLEGNSWLGTKCTGGAGAGEADRMVWSKAMGKYGIDGSDWRLPNVDELASIRTGNSVKSEVDRMTGQAQSGCTSPAYSENLFGDIDADPWTSTTDIHGERVWIIDMGSGHMHVNRTDEDKVVLLVKGNRYIGPIIRSGNTKGISKDNLSKINSNDSKELERRRVQDEKMLQNKQDRMQRNSQKQQCEAQKQTCLAQCQGAGSCGISLDSCSRFVACESRCRDISCN